MRRSLRFTALVVGIGGLVLSSAATASAKPGGGNSTSPKLEFFNCASDGAIYGACDTNQPGSIDWIKGQDATGDTDGFSLAVTTNANDPGGTAPAGVSYAGANVLNTPIQDQPLNTVDALSFQTKGFQGGGAPRISLILSGGYINGGTAFLDPEYCETSPDANGWRTADFREPSYDQGANATEASCTIYTTFGTFTDGSWQPGEGPQIGGSYTAFDWMNWAASNGATNEPTVSQIVFVQDAGPGTSYNDNLVFGAGPVAQPVVATHTATFTAPPGQQK